MSVNLETKINQLDYLHSAWQIIYDFDADDLDSARSQIEQAVMSISKELVELYRAEKLGEYLKQNENNR